MDWLEPTEAMKSNCACPVCKHVPFAGRSDMGELIYTKVALTCGNCGITFTPDVKNPVVVSDESIARIERKIQEELDADL